MYDLCFRTYLLLTLVLEKPLFLMVFTGRVKSRGESPPPPPYWVAFLRSGENENKGVKANQDTFGPHVSSKTAAGECQGHRVFLERTVWYPKAQCLGWENPHILAFCELPCPLDLHEIGSKLPASWELCMFLELFHWASGRQRSSVPSLNMCIWHCSCRPNAGFLWVLLLKSGWSRRYQNMEVGAYFIWDKMSTGKELNSVSTLETSLSFSGFKLII